MAGEMLRAYFISYFSALGMEPAFLKISNDIILILIGFFHLPKIEDDTIGENDRNEFSGINRKEIVNVSNIR
mgnify:CR=1 FL=1